MAVHTDSRGKRYTNDKEKQRRLAVGDLFWNNSLQYTGTVTSIINNGYNIDWRSREYPDKIYLRGGLGFDLGGAYPVYIEVKKPTIILENND